MLGISWMSNSSGLRSHWLAEALLNMAFLRAALRRMPRPEALPDHLRHDVGLPPREHAIDPRDLRW